MTPQPRYQPGNRIGGRYQVHKALLGGMGEVYLCLDLKERLSYALKTFQQREELKLFNLRLSKVPDTGGERVPMPSNMGHWLNVYSTNDVLSFACEQVFADVTDYEYPAGSLFGMRAAHSLYSERVSFYERLAYRLQGLWT